MTRLGRRKSAAQQSEAFDPHRYVIKASAQVDVETCLALQFRVCFTEIKQNNALDCLLIFKISTAMSRQLFRWIETYNTICPHSTSGMLAPVNYENSYSEFPKDLSLLREPLGPKFKLSPPQKRFIVVD